MVGVIGESVGWLVDVLDAFVGWLAGWLVCNGLGWLIDLFVGWSVGGLVGQCWVVRWFAD